MKIVVDHVAGSRQGQRQEFEPADRIRFGRHPDNEVAFDAHSDLDASSRHAELRKRDQGYTLRDVGSSNGTFIADLRVTEVTVEPGKPVLVEFGEGGPRVRIFVGDADGIAELPEIEEPQQKEASGEGSSAMLLAVVAALIAAVAAVIWWRFLG